MKFRILALTFLFPFFSAKSQKIFKVINAPWFDFHNINNSLKFDTSIKHYRILINDSDHFIPMYPMAFPKNIDTLKAVEELLGYEGDKRLCALPIMCYSLISSQLYIGQDSTYSLQLEALYIINQLVYNRALDMAAYPIIINRKTNKKYFVDGTGIHEAYQAYRKWYQLLKEKGASYLNEKYIWPLDDAPVRWY